jgi:hypothetical protein
MLITVYQYLYHVINVSYYREPGYLNYTYEIIENWIDEDEDGEDEDYRKYQRSEFERMKTSGDSLLRVIKEPFNIEMMELMLKRYRDSADWDLDADSLVQEFEKLAKDYPGRSIKHSIPFGVYETGENDLICLEHYLSFYWSSMDGFQEMIDDTVNNELNEMGYQEEPVAVQWFDIPHEKEHHDFDFEVRLFALLNELIDLVNEYDHEKHHE